MSTDPTQPLPATGPTPDGPTDGTATSGTAAYDAPTPATGPGAAWTTATAGTRPEREVSTSVRTGTIVWGAILVVAAVVLGAAAAGYRLDLGLVAIVALAGAGVALLVGSLVSAVRKGRTVRT